MAGLAARRTCARRACTRWCWKDRTEVGGRARTDEFEGSGSTRLPICSGRRLVDARLGVDYLGLDLVPSREEVDGALRRAVPPHLTDLLNGNRPTAGVGLELVAEAYDEGPALPYRHAASARWRLNRPRGSRCARTHAIASGGGARRRRALPTASGCRRERWSSRPPASSTGRPTAGSASPASTSKRARRRSPARWLVPGDGEGPIVTLCAVTEAAPEYAPASRTLVAVGVAGGEPGPARRPGTAWPLVRRAHPRVATLAHLRHRSRRPGTPSRVAARAPARLAPGLYACGDHREHPSLTGALASGRRAAEAVLSDLT